MRPRPIEHFAELYLRQPFKQPMGAPFASGRNYASVLSLSFRCDHLGRVNKVIPSRAYFHTCSTGFQLSWVTTRRISFFLYVILLSFRNNSALMIYWLRRPPISGFCLVDFLNDGRY